MRYINKYVMLVYELLEKPRNELIKKRRKKKYKKIINNYDKELFKQYCKIEEMLDKELN